MIYFINKENSELIAHSFENNNPIIPIKGDEITLKDNNWIIEKLTFTYEDVKGFNTRVAYKNLYVYLKKINENG